MMTPIIAWVVTAIIHFALYLFEAAALLLAAMIAMSASRSTYGRVRSAARSLDALARRRSLSVLLIGLGALALRSALLPVVPTRSPAITDEFSYLLAADTFASGRLTNPTHPMWTHFESIHILQYPTNASMYHAAQGMILAAGKCLTGQECWGVYASSALMCGLICWMLQGWLPPKWALLGGVFAVIRLGLFSYWTNSYWGGAAAAIGGLLVLGALPRLQRRMRAVDCALMATGMVILANSRPYEGFVLCIGVGVVLTVWFAKQGRGQFRAATFARAVTSGLLVLMLGAAGMTHYYRSVTGNPLRMPYQVDRDRYAPAGIFLWEQPRPTPSYPDHAMRTFYARWELDQFLEAKAPSGLLKNCVQKAGVFWMFFLGPALTLPLIFIPQILRDRRVRPLIVIGVISVAGMALNTWFYPHYAAPMTGAVYAVVLQGMRHLRVWRYKGRASGLLLAHAVPAVCICVALVRVCFQPPLLYTPADWPMTWYYTRPGNLDRARILTALTKAPGPHLVIVRYRPNHDPLSEWVYNRASIDSAPVVWARDLGASQNDELIRYFNHRRVWLVDPDANPATISEYRGQAHPTLRSDSD